MRYEYITNAYIVDQYLLIQQILLQLSSDQSFYLAYIVYIIIMWLFRCLRIQHPSHTTNRHS